MYKRRALVMLLMTMMIGIPIAKADVQSVDFRFCDDTEGKDFLKGKRNFMVTPGEEMELCMNFGTNSDTPVRIVYGFTVSYLNPSGLQMCDADKSSTNAFSKYITSAGERSFMLQKGETKKVIEKVMLPLGMSGIQYGCIAYSLATPQGDAQTAQLGGEGGMFNLIVNKVFPISFFVGKSADIKSSVTLIENEGGEYTTNKAVKATTDEKNNLILGFKVKNEGNVSQDVIISGRVYNMFGFEKSFSMNIARVAPGTEKDLEGNVGIIPAYKGLFNVEYMMQNTPKFEFDTTNLSEDAKKGGVVTGTAKIYLFSWISIAIVIVLLAIILKLVRPRRRKETVAVA